MQADQGERRRPGRTPSAPGRAVWIGVYTILVVAALLALFGDAARDALRYDRAGLIAGQYWRLFGAHLVHLDWSHTILNGAALWLLVAAVGRGILAREWLYILIGSIIGVDAGLYWLMPELSWYVGLSGLLHGALAGPALLLCLRRSPLGWVLLGLLTVKLAWEVYQGPLPGTSALITGPVVTEAHLFGAIGGLAGALSVWLVTARRPV